MKPIFNNRPNRPIHTTEGEVVWTSRSVALIGQVCAYCLPQQQWYILLVKRGVGTPDFQGYWCLPCGYLDWDETLTDGLLREVFEETGLYLPALSQHPHFGYAKSSLTRSEYQQTMPWAISDHPSNGKQNISMHYAVFFAWNDLILPALTDANSEPQEVAGLQWAPIEQAMNMELAFNHHVRISIMREQLASEIQLHQQPMAKA